ncbi:hypothetical protein EV126DRAFT_176956 [Verticillium dahliae]|nr:hypothetical protein EV126DRAFT_176956 [Verticillium dahliae]
MANVSALLLLVSLGALAVCEPPVVRKRASAPCYWRVAWLSNWMCLRSISIPCVVHRGQGLSSTMDWGCRPQ